MSSRATASPTQLSWGASFTPGSPRRGSSWEGAAFSQLPQLFQRLQDPTGRLVFSLGRTLPAPGHHPPSYTSGPAAPSSQHRTQQEGMLRRGSRDTPCAPKTGLASRPAACQPVTAPECGTHAGGTERPAGGASLDALLRKLGARGRSP